MKKSLLIVSAAMLTVSFAGQAGNRSSNSVAINSQDFQNSKVAVVEAAPVHMEKAANATGMRKAAKMPVVNTVKYMKPRGTMISVMDNTGAAYYAPFLQVYPYRSITFKSVGLGDATNTNWKLQMYESGARKWFQRTMKDLKVAYGLELDTVPTVSVGASSYQLQGNYTSGETTTYYQGRVCSVANLSQSGFDPTLYTSPGYCGLAERGSSDNGGFTYYKGAAATEGQTDGYWFGTNASGWDCFGLGLEKGEYPYIIKSALVRYARAYVTADTELKATLYKVGSFDGDSVITSLGEVIAEAKAILPAQGTALSPKSGLLEFSQFKQKYGDMEIPVDPEIDDDCVLVISGYNNVSTIKSFSMLVSTDEQNETYIPASYMGGLNPDGSIAGNQLNSLWGFFKSGALYSAPSIFVQAEYPWIVFYKNAEENVKSFADAGETYELELWSYQPSTEWNITDKEGNDLPSWVKVSIADDEEDGEYSYHSVATITVDPLPAGTAGRGCALQFDYPGAKINYYVNQGNSGVASVTADGINVTVANDNFVVAYPANVNNMKVYNVAGQLVKDVTLDASGAATVNAEGLANGMYIIKFNNNFTTKVVK